VSSASSINTAQAQRHGLCGQHFPDNDAVIAAVRKWLASAGAGFYERWQKCITNGGDYVEK
jgi:hypothetical protein